jgi:hypothetical protein
MWFFYLKKLPFGFLFKVLKLKKKIKFFIFFKNKVYTNYLSSNLFLVSRRPNILMASKLFSKTFLKNIIVYNFLIKGFLNPWQGGIHLIGVGFRFLVIKKKSFIIKLGYSHLIKFYLSDGFVLLRSLRRPNRILFFSPNKTTLSKILSSIKNLKNLDNYKGKGVKSFGEVIILKKQEKFGN